MGARLLYHDKRVSHEGDITEIKIWKVPVDKDFRDGIKYSLTYIHDGERLFGLDNERGKGHHEHRYGQEKKIVFTTWQKLLGGFRKELDKIRGELYGNENKEH